MKIEVRLFASFTRYLPDHAEDHRVILDLAEGTTVKQVLQKLQVPLDEIKLVFVNSVRAGLDHVLSDGDRMGAFPPVAGG